MLKHHLAAGHTPRSASRRNIFALVLGICLSIALALAGVQQLIAQGPQPRPSIPSGRDGAAGSGPRSPQGVPLPTGFTYQGRLLNADAPVNGVCDIAFRLYDDPGVGNQIGSAITQTIPITGGLFTTSLDFGAGAFNGQARWLQIALSNTCPATGSFTTLNPRQALSAAPYALFSTAPWVTSGSSLYYNSGNVGIGATNPGARLQVAGSGFFGTDGGGLNPSVGAGIRIFRDGFNGVANIYAFDYGTGSPFTLTLQAPGGNVGIGTTAPADKLSVAGIVATTGGVRFGDGTLQTTAARKGQNLIVVAKSGGDFTTISSALASIVNASATNHYLIYVAPGTYTETVTMKQYVDIEGAGELATKITQVGDASGGTGTVVGASNAELRFVSVENTGGALFAIALYYAGASARLTHVTASASGGTSFTYGLLNANASSAINNSTISASGPSDTYAIDNVAAGNSFTMTVNSSQVSAYGGTTNDGIRNAACCGSHTLLVNNSQVSGSTSTIFNDSHFTTRVGASQLSGGAVVANGGAMTCAGVYDENYAFFASTCP